jgi:hypothetical protein
LSKSDKSPVREYAEIESFEICGLKIPTGPLSLWRYAKWYCTAAALLSAPEGRSFEPVRYYLACHSIELSLKAYLSLHGMSLVHMMGKRLSHSLDAILSDAESKGLTSVVELSPQHRAQIKIAAKYYGGKLFEYPVAAEALLAYPSLPDIGVLREAARVLVDSLAQPCKAY